MREGWSQRSLGDVATIYNGNSINADEKKKKYLGQTQGLPFIATKDVGNDGVIDYENGVRIPNYTDFKIAHPDSVFVCAEGGSAGKKVAFVEQEVCFGNKLFALQPKKALLNGRYLYYFVQSQAFKEQFKQLITGIIGGVSSKKFKEIPIILSPLPEQQRIVDILDQEFAKIDALKTNAEKSLQAAKDLFQATLKKELEPKGGWSVAEIGSVCLKTDNIKWRDIPEDKEYTYIDLTSVDRSTKSVVEPQRIKKSNAPSRAQRLVCEDDIIFATTRPTLRRYCIITEQYDGQICSTGFCVLRPDKRKVRPSWLFHCLSTDAFYDYVEPLQTGATYPAITDKDVKGYTISLPTIKEQDDIVSRLNDLNDKSNTLQDNYQKTLTLCDDLKQSLLRKAFNGEL